MQAYAAARFTESVLRGLEGEQDVYEAAYVESKVTELPYFATKVRARSPCQAISGFCCTLGPAFELRSRLAQTCTSKT